MELWMAFWKFVLIATVGLYAIMAVWVTFQGALDIKALFSSLRDRHEESGDDTPPGGGNG